MARSLLSVLLAAAALIVAGCRDDEARCDLTVGWSAAPPVLGGAIQETAVVALDGKIYVLGGFNAALEVVDSVRIYDPATCAWSDGPPLPRPIHHANAAVVNGAIYVLGAMETRQFGAIGDSYAWRPGDAGWTTKASMPPTTQRGSAAVGAIGDVIYLAGGLRNGSVATVSAYSTTTDTWNTNLPPLPMARDHGCGGAVNGKLYAIGGRGGSIGAVTGRVFEYTPGDPAWIEKAPMPTARGGIACGVLGDRIIAVGGEGNPTTATRVFAEVEAYTVSTNTWTALPAMATPRHGMGAAVYGGALYVPGGATKEGFGAVDTHEVLQP
jgi:N-acetylneuraminic acid mutarotase